MGVYSQVSRWVDTNEGDDKSPNYRSRLVGREVRIDSRLDLFAPTPPLEAMKFLILMCARCSSVTCISPDRLRGR